MIVVIYTKEKKTLYASYFPIRNSELYMFELDENIANAAVLDSADVEYFTFDDLEEYLDYSSHTDLTIWDIEAIEFRQSTIMKG